MLRFCSKSNFFQLTVDSFLKASKGTNSLTFDIRSSVEMINDTDVKSKFQDVGYNTKVLFGTVKLFDEVKFYDGCPRPGTTGSKCGKALIGQCSVATNCHSRIQKNECIDQNTLDLVSPLGERIFVIF